ncbi:MFS transporter [Nocardia donostiensis]|uniref:MFS transporter n=1 Tax=Nocardia donostiensis TaxID=1538463 RepID=UPI001FE94D5B|nr:MFS transporter [Nocardia donostiensis]
MRAVLFAGTADLIPLYALYALLFADHGLDTGQISLLLALWSATAFVLEVPSGAWADTVSRRLLLVLSGVLLTGAFALWTVWPSYAGFAAGFMLWGVSGALSSGTFEALLYDELAASGAATEYPRILGYTRAATETAGFVAILAAAPLYLLGGYELVGWASVACAIGHTLIATTLPAAPKAVSAAQIEDLEEEPVPTADRGDGAGKFPTSAVEPPETMKTAAVRATGKGGADAATGSWAGTEDASATGGASVITAAVAGSVRVDGLSTECSAKGSVAEAATGADRAQATVDGVVDGLTASASLAGVVSVGTAAAGDDAAGPDVAGAAATDRQGQEHGQVPAATERPVARYLAMLRTGIAEAIRVRAVRHGVVLGALLYGITAFDEYFALVAAAAGAATSVVPVLVGVTVAGSLAGSMLAARTEGMRAKTVSLALAVGGVLFIAGAVVAGLAVRWPALVYVLTGIGFTAIGVSYGIVYNAGVIAAARLQDAIEGPARATVTSVSGLLEEVVSLAVFGFVALASVWLSISSTVALLGAAILVIAALTPAWLPDRRPA